MSSKSNDKPKAKTLRDIVEGIVFDGCERGEVPLSLKKEADAKYAFLQEVFEATLDELPHTPVRMKNFCTFYMFEGKQRALNPQTGDVVDVKENRQMKIRMSRRAKAHLNKKR